MKAKMTVYKNGGKAPIVPDPKKKMPAHFTTDASKMSKTPSELEVLKLKSKQDAEMKDFKAAGRIGADQSGIFEGMKVTNKKMSEAEAKAVKERAAKEMARAAFTKKYSKGGKMNVAGATSEDQYKYMGYGMGGKMKKYLTGGQVKLDVNKDGKISSVDFKMLKKK